MPIIYVYLENNVVLVSRYGSWRNKWGLSAQICIVIIIYLAVHCRSSSQVFLILLVFTEIFLRNSVRMHWNGWRWQVYRIRRCHHLGSCPLLSKDFALLPEPLSRCRDCLFLMSPPRGSIRKTVKICSILWNASQKKNSVPFSMPAIEVMSFVPFSSSILTFRFTGHIEASFPPLTIFFLIQWYWNTLIP